MKEGIYYCSLDDFLEKNRDSKTKKILLVAEYTNFKLEKLQNYKGEVVGAIVPFIVYNNDFFHNIVILVKTIVQRIIIIYPLNCI